MEIRDGVMTLPAETTLVVLAGISGTGKSYWAERLFLETQIVASDRCRGIVSDDEDDQNATAAAFSLLNTIVEMRLRYGRTTVVDSTALRARDRKRLVKLAKDVGAPAVLVAFEGDLELGLEGQRVRGASGGRVVPESAVTRMAELLPNTIERIHSGEIVREEGFHSGVALSREAADAIRSVEGPLDSLANLRYVDVVGDVHGCLEELIELLHLLGYKRTADGGYSHPEGRRIVFVGDLVDRGPDSLGVMRLAARMIADGDAVMGALGNHDWKAFRLFGLDNRKVSTGNGLDLTVAQVIREDAWEEMADLCRFVFAQAPASSVYDDGQLVITHGAVHPEDAGKPVGGNRKGRHGTLGLYGEVEGEVKPGEFPNRVYLWAKGWPERRPQSTVLFGHDVFPGGPEQVEDNVWGIDTGCVFGGTLTAVRWPGHEVVQVPSRQPASGKIAG